LIEKITHQPTIKLEMKNLTITLIVLISAASTPLFSQNRVQQNVQTNWSNTQVLNNISTTNMPSIQAQVINIPTNVINTSNNDFAPVVRNNVNANPIMFNRNKQNYFVSNQKQTNKVNEQKVQRQRSNSNESNNRVNRVNIEVNLQFDNVLADNVGNPDVPQSNEINNDEAFDFEIQNQKIEINVAPAIQLNAPVLNLALPSINPPSIDLPTISLPSISLPTINLPKLKLPTRTKTAKHKDTRQKKVLKKTWSKIKKRLTRLVGTRRKRFSFSAACFNF